MLICDRSNMCEFDAGKCVYMYYINMRSLCLLFHNNWAFHLYEVGYTVALYTIIKMSVITVITILYREMLLERKNKRKGIS